MEPLLNITMKEVDKIMHYHGCHSRTIQPTNGRDHAPSRSVVGSVQAPDRGLATSQQRQYSGSKRVFHGHFSTSPPSSKPAKLYVMVEGKEQELVLKNEPVTSDTQELIKRGILKRNPDFNKRDK